MAFRWLVPGHSSWWNRATQGRTHLAGNTCRSRAAGIAINARVVVARSVASIAEIVTGV
jgi:hypothetical protein